MAKPRKPTPPQDFLMAIAEIKIFGYPIQNPANRLIQYRRTRRPGPVAGI